MEIHKLLFTFIDTVRTVVDANLSKTGMYLKGTLQLAPCVTLNEQITEYS